MKILSKIDWLNFDQLKMKNLSKKCVEFWKKKKTQKNVLNV